MRWYKLFTDHIDSYESFENSWDNMDEYYQKYLRNIGASTERPNCNVFLNHDFLLPRNLNDIYLCSGKISRHLIVSPRLHSIFCDFDLFGCTIFEGLRMKNKSEIREDYLLYVFYLNMWDNVDFKASKFIYEDIFTRNYIEDIMISSKEEYEEIESENGRKTGRVVGFKEIVFRYERFIDLFYLFNIDNRHPIVSERLYNRLINEKLIGVEFGEVTKRSFDIKID